jgi:predicted nucleotidyltransferase component of viral defense system
LKRWLSMTDATARMAASVRDRLLTKARATDVDFQGLLLRYALERLLYRLGQSVHNGTFVLKGATLFSIWLDAAFRPTRDIDLLGFGDLDEKALTHIFADICALTPAEPDGVLFDATTIKAVPIRAAKAYGGITVSLVARIAAATLTVRIDIGFGDVVTPSPVEVSMPVLLDHPRPQLRAYPPETVIAEKFEAIVTLGEANTRIKDYFDLWMLRQHFTLDQALVAAAIRATFARRNTDIPAQTPDGLTDHFASDVARTQLWQAFLKRIDYYDDLPAFPILVGVLRDWFAELIK